MAKSVKVATGGTFTSTNFNNLRDDVLDATVGHNHDGTEGRRIDHNNLLNKGNVSHADLDSHVMANKGVHGAPSNFFVLSAKPQTSAGETSAIVMVYGTAAFTTRGEPGEMSTVITYGGGFRFTSTPQIFLMPDSTQGIRAWWSEPGPEGVESGFILRVREDAGNRRDRVFYIKWMAIGRK